MNEIMYLREINNKIICTNYFGENLEKKKKFIIKSFHSNQKILKIAKNDKKIYILLNSSIVLVFNDINMLKNEIFKDFTKGIQLKYLKYYLKLFSNNLKFHLCKTLDKEKMISAGCITTTSLLTLFLITSNNPTKNIKNNNERNNYQILEANDYPEIEINLTSNAEDLKENSSSIESSTNEIDKEYTLIKDSKTTIDQIASNQDFYTGETYENLVSVMNDYEKTVKLNNEIQEYISNNLKGKMWANLSSQECNNYKIPDKYKNGTFTLDELFSDASKEFNVPKDILVAVSQHECGQGYYLQNNERNCGGMMGYLNLDSINSYCVPNNCISEFDAYTNPTTYIYAYASTLRFFYNNFKDINISYGFDAWDIALAMVSIGVGNVTNNDIGFKYKEDFDKLGISQLNICAPQFKALREAYLNGKLGVNDLTFTAHNGEIIHWVDGDKFYYIDGELEFNRAKNKVLIKTN